MRTILFLVSQVLLALPSDSIGIRPSYSPLPPGLSGLYEGSHNADGTTRWTYIGPRRPSRKVRGTDETIFNTYICTGAYVDGVDARAAIVGFNAMCGYGRHFDKVLAYVHGTAVAYGCSFGDGKGHTCAYGNYNSSSFLRGIEGACGKDKTGLFVLPDEKVSYGLTHIQNNIC
ncbi:mannose-6-phosphate isomerase, class I [Ophiocordyceps camponoti-floridani]|uniref:Mannose-6-phosphate isomerase, class I n=1 Tax=Ophiocordyceps camponoti-floridani TaxID=2030778 RepID=A0A8H4VFI4_9HYPO|nr:mannose-6-phosphate isomerase, class I [Ophiocordyceps camponoti-floridani]